MKETWLVSSFVAAGIGSLLACCPLAVSSSLAEDKSEQAPADQDAGAQVETSKNPEAEVVVKGARDPKMRKVCKTVTSTGSITPKRVCQTVAEIEQRQAEAERMLERARSQQDTDEQIRLLRELTN
ncbi:MAG: hypothetical protein KDE32_15640 [Novosphingobium sp.]|nr:hypothetical protein [Novosphingobium sp.]